MRILRLFTILAAFSALAIGSASAGEAEEVTFYGDVLPIPVSYTHLRAHET